MPDQPNPLTVKEHKAFRNLYRFCGGHSSPALSHLKGDIENETKDQRKVEAYELLEDFIAKRGRYQNRESLNVSAETTLTAKRNQIRQDLEDSGKVYIDNNGEISSRSRQSLVKVSSKSPLSLVKVSSKSRQT